MTGSRSAIEKLSLLQPLLGQSGNRFVRHIVIGSHIKVSRVPRMERRVTCSGSLSDLLIDRADVVFVRLTDPLRRVGG